MLVTFLARRVNALHRGGRWGARIFLHNAYHGAIVIDGTLVGGDDLVFLILIENRFDKGIEAIERIILVEI